MFGFVPSQVRWIDVYLYCGESVELIATRKLDRPVPLDQIRPIVAQLLEEKGLDSLRVRGQSYGPELKELRVYLERP